MGARPNPSRGMPGVGVGKGRPARTHQAMLAGGALTDNTRQSPSPPPPSRAVRGCRLANPPPTTAPRSPTLFYFWGCPKEPQTTP